MVSYWGGKAKYAPKISSAMLRFLDSNKKLKKNVKKPIVSSVAPPPFRAVLRRLCRKLPPVLAARHRRRKIVGYWEPFAGMASVMRRMHVLRVPRIGSDIHTDLMMMLNQTVSGKFDPPKAPVGKARWRALKHSDRPSALRGFVGHAHDAVGKWYSHYWAAGNEAEKGRDAILALAQDLRLGRGSKFFHGTFDDPRTIKQVLGATKDAANAKRSDDLRDFIIFCDPPYANTSAVGQDQGKRFTDADRDRFLGAVPGVVGAQHRFRHGAVRAQGLCVHL